MFKLGNYTKDCPNCDLNVCVDVFYDDKGCPVITEHKCPHCDTVLTIAPPGLMIEDCYIEVTEKVGGINEIFTFNDVDRV